MMQGPTNETARTARIAVLSDLHVMRGEEGAARLYRKRLEVAIAQVNREAPDAVLIAGDLTEDGSAEQLEVFVTGLAMLSAPVLYIPGNHDVGNKRLPGGPPPAADALRTYEGVAGPSWFATEVAGLHCVGINATLLGSGLPQEKAQWDWLEAQMRRGVAGPVVALTHYPLYLSTPAEPGGDYWTVEPEPRRRLLDLLVTAGAAVVISGHLHRPNFASHAGITFAGAPSVAFGLPADSRTEGWMMVTIDRNRGVRCEVRLLSEQARP